MDAEEVQPATFSIPRSLCTPRLKDLFQRSSNLQYFKRLIQIPQLPEVSVPAGLCMAPGPEHCSIL